MKSISTAITISESENFSKLNHGHKRRKKRKELNAYLTKRKSCSTPGAQVHLLDNEDCTDDSYAENIIRNKHQPEHRSKFKSKSYVCDIFVVLWTFSWLIGTIFSIWLFFDIKKQFSHFQIEINELKNSNKLFPSKVEHSEQIIQELKLVQVQFREKIVDLENQIANLTINSQNNFQNFQKMQNDFKNASSQEIDKLKKSNQELEMKFEYLQKYISNFTNNTIDNNHVRNS